MSVQTGGFSAPKAPAIPAKERLAKLMVVSPEVLRELSGGALTPATLVAEPTPRLRPPGARALAPRHRHKHRLPRHCAPPLARPRPLRTRGGGRAERRRCGRRRRRRLLSALRGLGVGGGGIRCRARRPSRRPLRTAAPQRRLRRRPPPAPRRRRCPPRCQSRSRKGCGGRVAASPAASCGPSATGSASSTTRRRPSGRATAEAARGLGVVAARAALMRAHEIHLDSISTPQRDGARAAADARAPAGAARRARRRVARGARVRVGSHASAAVIDDQLAAFHIWISDTVAEWAGAHACLEDEGDEAAPHPRPTPSPRRRRRLARRSLGDRRRR